METPTFVEAFNLAFELVVKWVFVGALFFLFVEFAVFIVCVWKALSGETEHLCYPRCW
jgi:hypothetical protein